MPALGQAAQRRVRAVAARSRPCRAPCPRTPSAAALRGPGRRRRSWPSVSQADAGSKLATGVPSRTRRRPTARTSPARRAGGDAHGLERTGGRRRSRRTAGWGDLPIEAMVAGARGRWSGRCLRAPDDAHALDGTGGPLPSTESGRTLMSAFATHRSRDNPGETWGVGHGSSGRTTWPSGTLDEPGGTGPATTSRVTMEIPASRPESRVGSTDRASSVPPALCRGHVRLCSAFVHRRPPAGDPSGRGWTASLDAADALSGRSLAGRARRG